MIFWYIWKFAATHVPSVTFLSEICDIGTLNRFFSSVAASCGLSVLVTVIREKQAGQLYCEFTASIFLTQLMTNKLK